MTDETTDETIPDQIAQDREHYEQHPDGDDWGEAVPAPAKPRRRLATMVSVRLSPDEAAEVRAAAAAENLSVSGFLRQAALDRAAVHQEPRPARMGWTPHNSNSNTPTGSQNSQQVAFDDYLELLAWPRRVPAA